MRDSMPIDVANRQKNMPAWREHAPAAREHGIELGVVARKMQHGAADDDGGRPIRHRRPFNRLGAKVFWREGGRQPRGELAHGADGVGVLIDGVDVAASAQQIDEIAAPAAAGVEDTIAWRDAAAQQLIEQIDVDPAELGLEIHRRVDGLYLLTGRGAPPPRLGPRLERRGAIIGIRRETSWTARPQGSRSIASTSPASFCCTSPSGVAPAAMRRARVAATSSAENAMWRTSGSIAR